MTAPTAPPRVRPVGRPGDRGDRPDRPRRRPTELDRLDYGVLAGSAVSALAFTWLVFTKLTEGVGWFGFVLATYVVFLGIFALVSADRVGRLTAGDRVATVVVTTGAVALLVPLLSLIGYVVVKGLPALRVTFFAHDQRGVLATDEATAGGGAHALVGSLIQVGLALIMTVPLANDIVINAATIGTPQLRTLDALHLATAAAIGSELDHVVTYDKRLAEAAAGFGLSVAAPF